MVVTGGSRGIGRGLVEKLLTRGNRVIATTRNPDSAIELQRLAQTQPELLTVTALDVSSPESIRAWADTVAAATSHVDVLINNAGVYGPRVPDISSVLANDLVDVFNTNAVGPLLVVQQLLARRLLGAPGNSLVVSVSNIMASHGDTTVSSVTPGGYGYRASKAALNIMTKAMTLELKDAGVQFVLVHPGYVKTDMTGTRAGEGGGKGRGGDGRVVNAQ